MHPDLRKRRHPGRSGRPWLRARAQVLKNATHCELCGGELDFDAPPRSPMSPSVDHIVPLKAMRHLSMEEQRKLATNPSLLRPAHYGCNSRRGAATRTEKKVRSREW